MKIKQLGLVYSMHGGGISLENPPVPIQTDQERRLVICKAFAWFDGVLQI